MCAGSSHQWGTHEEHANLGDSRTDRERFGAVHGTWRTRRNRETGASISSGMISASPGVTAPKHWHPGEEIIYVLEGSLEY
jgi:quercetin dioxygenase-like cupin family protein